MFRTIAIIAAAIEVSQPKIEDEAKQAYAQALQQEAHAHDFDPLTGVSIIHFESNFNPKAISRSGEDYGLAQIRARYIGACKKDANPKDAPGPACRQVKDQLLDGVENIRVMADLITQNRAFCMKKVGSNQFARWLASYQGRNNVRKKQWCKPGDGTYKVIRYRTTLLNDLTKRRELKKEFAITRPPEGSTPAKAPEEKAAERQEPSQGTAPHDAASRRETPRGDAKTRPPDKANRR
jgi:hypothetical protein